MPASALNRMAARHLRPAWVPAWAKVSVERYSGDGLEELDWADAQDFLRSPGPVLEQLHGQFAGPRSRDEA